MHPGQSKMHPALIPGVHLVSLLALFANVVADYVSFATAFSFSKQTPSLIHSVAPPFQIEPTPLGFDLGFRDGASKSYNFTRTKKRKVHSGGLSFFIGGLCFVSPPLKTGSAPILGKQHFLIKPLKHGKLST